MKRMGRFLAMAMGIISAASQAATPEETEVSIYRDEPRSYAGASVVQFNLESDLLDQQPGGLMVRMGGRLDSTFGAEVRLAAGLWHEAQRDDVPNGVKKVVADVDYLVGGYFTGRWGWQLPYVRLPGISEFYLDGQLGLAALQVSAELETLSESTAEGDWDGFSLSYGAGLGMDFTMPFVDLPAAAGIQYMSYGSLEDAPSSGDDIDISSLEATLKLRF